MVAMQEVASKTASNERKYRSPNRVLARSFRMARDKWKQKYMDVRAELKRARQLATERGDSRDRWRAECEAAIEQARAAETQAQERLQELEQLRARELEAKKTFLAVAS
jgi:DNA-directed RNA polymerase subunit K/omega